MVAARFDTLIGHQVELSERRRRMMSSALMAAVLSMAAGTTAYVGDKMGITMVAPPSNAYAVTLQVLEVPPPPQIPERPEGGGAVDAKDDPETSPPEPAPRVEEAPTEQIPIDLAKPPRRLGAAGSGKEGGLAGGSGGPGLPGIGGPPGIGTCVLPPCVGTPIPRVVRPPSPAPRTELPIDAARATATYDPDPDPKALARTETGRSNRRAGRSSVHFCIDERGRTFDLSTQRGFRGDPEVDRICRQTVAKWRFTPMRVGGKARTTCSTVTFEIQFD
ncbi:MAG: hypothetical protein H6712_02820 [Myxococcales bacterium]|nr:hypothetical protein [Myxococcales bacterium]MCB9712759.1 hypothetical protein [Myxococcales bacterium]